MKNLGAELQALTAALGSTNTTTAITKRAAEIRSLFRQAVEAVYKQNAEAVLTHINEVYVVDGSKVEVKRFDRPRYGKRNGGRILVVHCDDSIVRSDLDNYQEFIKLKFQEAGEAIDAMDIVPSIGEMKRRKPFEFGENSAAFSTSSSAASTVALTAEEEAEATRLAENVEDNLTRNAFLKAMIARRQREKGEQ